MSGSMPRGVEALMQNGCGEKSLPETETGKLGKPKRRFGTASMEVDAKGICDIIRTCHKANVRSLKFGDVEVNFGADQVSSSVSDVEPVPGFIPSQLGAGQVSMELSADQKAVMREAEETDLMITSPEEWEYMMIDRLVHKDRALDENRGIERAIPQG